MKSVHWLGGVFIFPKLYGSNDGNIAHLERYSWENVSWLYTSPATETATLKSTVLIYEFTIYNAGGEKVFSKNLCDEELSQYELLLQNLDKGMYLVNVVTAIFNKYYY